jgi:hypothetical protein
VPRFTYQHTDFQKGQKGFLAKHVTVWLHAPVWTAFVNSWKGTRIKRYVRYQKQNGKMQNFKLDFNTLRTN